MRFAKNLPAETLMVINENVAASLCKKEARQDHWPKWSESLSPETLCASTKRRFCKVVSVPPRHTHSAKSMGVLKNQACAIKKLCTSMPNDFQPIVITSILCKTMERVLASHLNNTVATMLNPLQFA